MWKAVPTAGLLAMYINFDVDYEGDKPLKLKVHGEALGRVLKDICKNTGVTLGQPSEGSIKYENCRARLNDFLSFNYYMQDATVLANIAKEIRVQYSVSDYRIKRNKW
jgi:hypothetical protein